MMVMITVIALEEIAALALAEPLEHAGIIREGLEVENARGCARAYEIHEEDRRLERLTIPRFPHLIAEQEGVVGL